MRKVMLAPSILNADFGDLGRALSYIEDSSDVVHLDVMDGNFVPNITFGPMVVKAIKSLTRLPLDAHLMIAEPLRYIKDFRDAGADWISFHAETVDDPVGAAQAIRDLGAKAGAAINPATPVSSLLSCIAALDFVLVMSVVPGFGGQSLMPEALEKISQVKEMAAAAGNPVPVQVDGGIKDSNLEAVVKAGADILVVGSSIYSDPDPAEAARRTRRILDELVKPS